MAGGSNGESCGNSQHTPDTSILDVPNRGKEPSICMTWYVLFVGHIEEYDSHTHEIVAFENNLHAGELVVCARLMPCYMHA